MSKKTKLKWKSEKVEAKVHPLEGPDYIFPYRVLWRIEKLIRKIIRKPAPMVPYTFKAEDCVCLPNANIDVSDLLTKELDYFNKKVMSGMGIPKGNLKGGDQSGQALRGNL